MLIEIKDLVKEFVNEEVVTSVLHGLSFNVKKGEFISIMGPSGSGKSTLMHILGLLDRASGGIYNLEGQNVTTLSDDELANLRNEKIGFVFQAFNLLPRTTVLENVKLPLTYSKNQKQIDERARKVLESVGLGHRLNFFTNQISGGEKQRVAIARALVNEPSVIFADEPTGNLDSKSGVQIMEILQDLNDAGNTIILVTHETYTAEHADRIIKVKDGLIVDDYAVSNKRKAKDGDMLK
ncbi:MAG: ABC transporter ATP-binding protein [Patescibacteria group bacterium]|nr:ABC transporter ATP-binding protein [Patescibacteria group bacterium]MDD4610831.1 ABC transporter ATP-binding protein [Patescibacteria group bacterium]